MKLTVIHTGYFKLDGGAMFGVVPKTMWNKMNPADENNLCTWSARCLLIEKGNQKILIDTGLGNKQDERFRAHFHPHGPYSLHKSLEQNGISPEEITDVILTHFHFDHVGGAAEYNKSGQVVPTFPNAIYWSNKIHYDWAYNTNPREAASFLKENFVPLKEMGVMKLIDVEQDVPFNDFIKFRFYYGHTEAMMVPFIDLPNGKTLVYPADLIPSQHHIRIPYVMSYDVRPLVTMTERSEFNEMMTDPDHYLFFEHDRDLECCRISKNEKGRFGMAETCSLQDLIPES